MIVVVIIGLLAALAIPAIRRARNGAVEKVMMNDARMLSSAANQYFTDSGSTRVRLGQLVGGFQYLKGLSSGTLIKQGAASANLTASNEWSASLLTVELASSNDAVPADSIVSIGNLGYDAAISSRLEIVDSAMGDYAGSNTNYLNFSVDTGALLKRSPASFDDLAGK